jgi:hypothetical protein
MADVENASAQPAGSEPAQHALTEATSESSIDAMLANVEGLDKYFGADSEAPDKPVKEKASASPGESGTAGAVTDEILGGGEQVEEKKEPEKASEELSEAVQARIDRLTAQKREFEESVSSLQQENAKLKTQLETGPAPAPTPEDPLGGVLTYQELEERLAGAKTTRDWAWQNLDGGLVQTDKDSGATRELSGQEVKQLLSLSERMIEEHIPRRKAYLDARIDFDRQADTYYPDLRKAESNLSRTVAAWVKAAPEVTRFPDFRLIIADALVGQKLRMSRLATKTNGSSVQQKSPTLAAPSPSAAPRTPAKSVLSKDLLDRMATDRSALDVFSESLIGTGAKKK